jgi:hypothetical protein
VVPPDPTQTQSPADVAAQPVIVGGVTVTQLSYIFDPISTTPPEVVAQTPADGVDGISRSLSISSATPTRSATPEQNNGQGSVSVLGAAQTNVPVLTSTTAGSGDGEGTSNLVDGYATTIAVADEVITLPDGVAVTADSMGEFVVGGSTYTPTGGTVVVVEGEKTESLVVVSQTGSVVVSETRGGAPVSQTESSVVGETGGRAAASQTGGSRAGVGTSNGSGKFEGNAAMAIWGTIGLIFVI